MNRDLLVCAGSLTLDNVITADGQRLPQTWGGNVVYSALGARIWHEHVGLVSRAGENFPDACIALLGARGMRMQGILRLPTSHGMNVAFCYRADGSRIRAFPPDVIDTIPPLERERFIDYSIADIDTRFAVWTGFAPNGSEIPDAWLPEIAAIHCAAMPVQHHHAIAARMRAGVAADAWVQVDSPWYDERDLARDEATALFAMVDAVLPSEDDVAKASPDKSIDSTLGAMQRKGARLIVLKRGSQGSRIIVPGKSPIDIPALPGALAVELTGAGDAFCGGFLAGMHLTREPFEAALYGTVSASFAIAAPGIGGLLAATRSEANRRLAALRTHISS